MSDPCKHRHLRFERGTTILRCIDCKRGWHESDDRGRPVYTGMSEVVLPVDSTRHSRWETPRTEPAPSPKKK